MKKKITCLSLDCPERKSVCCGAGSMAVQGDEGTGYFACKNCRKEFIGGKCKGKELFKIPVEETGKDWGDPYKVYLYITDEMLAETI